MMGLPRPVFYMLLLLCYASALSSNATSTPALRADGNNETFNVTGSTTPSQPPKRQAIKPLENTFFRILLALYALVFTVGVTGNTLVILTVASKRMRSVKNLLIGNLAIADLTTLVICLPITVLGLFTSWPFGIDVCRFFIPLTDVIVSASIATLCVITLDRFRAIVYPFTRKMSLKLTIWVIIIIWVISFLVVAVPLMEIMKIRRMGGTGFLACYPAWPSKAYKQAYRLGILVMLYFIPVCLIFFCFVCIWRKIKGNVRFMRESVRDTKSIARLRRRVRVVKLMFVIFLTFTLCLLPIHLLLTLHVFYPPSDRWPWIGMFYHVSILILVTNSCMNPIILYVMSSDFKQGFKEHCLCFLLHRRIRSRRKASNDVSHLDDNQTAGCITALQRLDSVTAKDIDVNKNGCNLIPMYPCINGGTQEHDKLCPS